MKKQSKDTKNHSSGTGMKGKSFGGGGIVPQTEKEKVLKSQGIDLKLLNNLSEEYILSPNSFQDLEKVETKLALLGDQFLKARNAQKKRAIKEVLDKYELQQKRLLKKEAEEKAKNKRNKNSSSLNTKDAITSPTTYAINEKDELVPLEVKEPNQQDAKEDKATGNTISGNERNNSNFTTPQRKQSSKPSVSPMSITPRNVYKGNDSTKRKLSNSNEKETKISATKKNTWSVMREKESGKATAVPFHTTNGSKEQRENIQRLTPPNLQEINKEKYIQV